MIESGYGMTINFGSPSTRGGGRLKAKFSRRVYNKLIESGFTKEEARFGAYMEVPLSSVRLQEVITHRKFLVEAIQRKFNCSREEAIEEAAKELKSKLLSLTGQDEDLILFYEVYPQW